MKQLGYLANLEIAQQIIGEYFKIPTEMDDATALILDEIERIGTQVKLGKTTSTISADKFYYCWKQVKEGTSSSYSRIHYGHYKSAAHSKRVSRFLAQTITLIVHTGCPPDRWSYGLTIMLEIS